MKITIYKYLLGSDTARNNYFDRTTLLDFTDKIVFNRQLKDGFPIFREEWASEEDINILKTGYFDLKLSLIMSELSDEGKNVYEFFENLKSPVGKYKFIVVCESNNVNRNYSGIVDLTQLNSDLTVIDNQYFIFLSVIGIETEVIDLLKSTVITKLLTDEVFETQYLPRLFYWLNPAKVQVLSTLDHEEKLLGTIIKIDRDLYNRIWNNNLDFTGTFCTITNWDAFRSFLKGYQFKFRVSFTSTFEDGPIFTLKLFFRTDGNGRTTLSKLKKDKQKLFFTGADNFVIFYTKRPDGINADLEHYTGFIMNRTNIYTSTTTQDFILHKTENIFYFGLYSFSADTLQILTLDTYKYGSIFTGDTIALCRCVSNSAEWYRLVQYISNLQCNYYIKATKEMKSLTHVVADDSNLQLGSIADIAGSDFNCERINSFDTETKTMESEWLEV